MCVINSKDVAKEMSKIDGIGMFDGVNINTVECKYIKKFDGNIGSISCQCLDFPHKCIVCAHNKYKAPTTIRDTRKHYFKEKKK